MANQFYEHVEKQIINLSNDSDLVILGDFNAKIQEICNRNFTQKISKNGIILNEIIERNNLVNLNCNTLLPTFISNNGKNKSILDYVFEKGENSNKIKNFEIDYDDIFRIKNTKNNYDYLTDHRKILLRNPMRKKKTKKTQTLHW